MVPDGTDVTLAKKITCTNVLAENKDLQCILCPFFVCVLLGLRPLVMLFRLMKDHRCSKNIRNILGLT